MTTELIYHAVDILNNGGVIIFPTDTAFGIGCRADNEGAVKRLFEVRKRPDNKATPVLVRDIGMAEAFVDEISEEVIQLTQRYWPGGLTIVLKSHHKSIVPLVKGGTDTLGVRMPDHEIPLAILKEIGVPLLAPSANFAGLDTPYSFVDLDPELTALVDLVIPGECTTKHASTVIDCTQHPWKIVRQGAVELDIKGKVSSS